MIRWNMIKFDPTKWNGQDALQSESVISLAVVKDWDLIVLMSLLQEGHCGFIFTNTQKQIHRDQKRKLLH